MKSKSWLIKAFKWQDVPPTYPPLDQYLTTIIYSIIFRAQFALQSSETNKMMAEQVIDSVGPEACE